LKYRYKLEGIDTNWYYPEEGKYTINYNNIPSGTYMLNLEISDANAIFRGNKHQIVLKIEKSPLKFLFILLFLLAVSLLVLIFTKKYQV